MTEELFQKFIDGHCGIGEREAVEQWLNNCTDAELNLLLKKRWDDADGTMPPEMSIQLWNQIRQGILTETAPVYHLPGRSIKKRWLAVACCITVLLTGYIFLKPKINEVNKETATISSTLSGNNNNQAWTIIRNDQASNKTVLLADKSVVVLYRNAIVRMPADFNRNERAVFLYGKAIFSVAKDRSRPFTVYSNDIATKAVGTRFSVNNDIHLNHIDIRLFEGVIEVKSIKNNITSGARTLHAGEEIHFGYAAVAENFIPHSLADNIKKAENHSFQDNENEISFSNTPLTEVFAKMEQLYHVKIDYRKDELKNMTLTSSVSKNDNAESLLKMIGQMHDLTISRTDSSFIITVQPINK